MLAQPYDITSADDRVHCLLWHPELYHSLTGIDLVFALACLSIGLSVGVFILKRKDISQRSLGVLFVGFILFLAATTLADAWNLWFPITLFHIVFHIGSAAVAIILAVALWRMMPEILRYPSLKQMEQANASLRAVQNDLQQAHQTLENKVLERTLELETKSIELHQTISELEAVREELESLVQHDALTGIWNRNKIRESAQLEMTRKARYGYPVSMIFIDLDHFKQINDQHGHAIGDDVLREFCKIVVQCMRSTDLLGRWGGEEFVIITPHSGVMIAVILAERICNALLSHDFPTIGRLTASFGVASCRQDETWESWFARADTALYAAKAQGRNQVVADKPEDLGLEQEELRGQSYLHLAWGGNYESGHQVIDQQHRNIFERVNSLMGTVLEENPKDQILQKIEDLISILMAHFADEEHILRMVNYDGVNEHATIHRGLISRTQQMIESYRNGKSVIAELFNFLAYEVVANHMFSEDRKLAELIQKHNNPPLTL